jgi:ppGpp synthetase/RelA/SpoT-type nucleotidyltranferase
MDKINNTDLSYSGKQVTKAGNFFLDNQNFDDDQNFIEAMNVLEWWRSCHQDALEPAFSKLQELVNQVDKNALYARRLKRKFTIAYKLVRIKERKMSLRNMQDIGGCRAIISNQKKLNQVIRLLKKQSCFKFINKKLKFKNYIKRPKVDGYRSFHIIGVFTDRYNKQRKIEFQIRTKIQHYWATALEIVDLFNNQSLKFNKGNTQWAIFFKAIGNVFSIIDNIHDFDNLSFDNQRFQLAKAIVKDEIIKTDCIIVKMQCKKLKIIEAFTGFTRSLSVIPSSFNSSESGYMLFIIDTINHTIKTEIFDTKEEANTKYTIAEIKASKNNSEMVSLVSSTVLKDIKNAYPNYFADSKGFIKMLNIIISLEF